MPTEEKETGRDWKGLAAMLGATLAVLGFFWNKAEGCASADRSDRIQSASYEKLAEKMDEVFIRLAVLEKMLDYERARTAEAKRAELAMPAFQKSRASQLPNFSDLRDKAEKAE